ncbi:MAG TPA: TetR/AcrR family transcriptional regulator, partial [Chroococcales cyanobacterium]|jgi:TetR/AcrR family transcriptional regulator
MEKDTQAKITEAALEEFAEKGKDGARMQAIADRAGVNKALLHYYFHTKDDLHLAVIRNFFQSFVLRLCQNAPVNQDPEAVVRLFVDTYMGMIQQNPKFPRIMMRLLLAPEGLEGIKREIFAAPDFEKLRTFLFGQLGALQALGHIQDVDPQAAMLSLLGSMIFYFIGKPLVSAVFPDVTEGEAGFERYKESLITIFTRGFLSEGRQP